MIEVTETWYTKADEQERQNFRDRLRGLLKDGVVRINFIKKDGTTRDMQCTLNGNIVPEYENKTDGSKKKNDEVLSVFDIEKNSWRSMRYESIREIRFILGE